ncbi:peptidase [Gardnerella sp. DNF00038]|uniref:peptidase n=1 Tax=Gardnerella sp. DNF00038 TaxID=2749041 RepID=UPI003BB0960B
MVSKSRKHANTVKLDAVVSKAIEKAVDMRKVAALSAGAAGVIAGAAIAFGATPAMAVEANVAPVNTNDSTKEQNLVAKKNAEADGSKDSDKTATETTKKDYASKIEDSKKAEPSAAKNDQADKKVATDKNVAETQYNKSKTEQNLTSSKNASVQSVVKTDGKKQIENNAEQKKIAEQNTASTESVDSKTTTNKTPAADKTNTTSSTTAENNAPAENVAKKSRIKRSLDENKQPETPASTVPQEEDRAGTEHNPDEVVFSQNLPNIYGWATPSNTFDTQLEKQKVVYHLPKSADGKPVVRVVILPDSKDSINTDDPEAYKKIIEFDSERKDEMHQSYSGIYELKTNTDGSVDLIMQQPFRDGGISSGQGYCANRSIFLYYDKTNLQHDKTSNNFRVATLVPPKTAGSIVLKYNDRLTADKVREVLHKAVNLPTEHKSGSSVADQLVAQSKSTGVGLRVDENTVNNTPDTVDAKIPQSLGSYDEAMFKEINNKNGDDYSFGERKLKTYLVTDLGMKSPEIPLTVVRYSTRIEKPVVDTVDFSKLTEDQKTQIKKNLAKLNGVSTDKVTFDNNGTATIDFDGLSPQDDPKIPLSDLVLTRVATDKVAIPSDSENSKVKAVVVANPLGYSQAELKQIKKAIYEANKDNQELGLSAKDYEKQISLEYLTGDTTASGGQNTGISNGMNENKITVTIRTDKAYAQFESDIQKHELTRLIDLRKDYTLSWEASNNKISGRTSDEGLAWMEDGKTLVYRYDPDKGEQINTKAVLGLLKATVKSDVKTDNPQLRENLLGTEIDTVKREGSNGQARRTHRSYTVDDKGEPIGVLNLVKLNGSSYGGFAKPVDNSNKKMGDEQSSVGDFTFDDDSKKVNVAGKTGKFMLGRLFIEPYSLYYYNYVYGENKYNLRNTPKGINVVFVPQTKNKIKDLKNSVGEHKTTTVDNKEVPTVAAYYNASADKKAAYDDALKVAQDTLTKVGNKTDADLTEELKAEVDNATITLNKAREALDGDATKKEELNKSIDEDGTPAQGQQATTGTKASDKYKNVTEPDFKDANGNTDTTKNEAARKAKTAYDDALTEANKVKEDKNATQKAVDDAKAKLDEARKALNDFTTNKDELNNAIAQHGKVNTGDATKTGNEKLKTADPTYQNSTSDERTAYDNAVKKANELSKDPNASQKDVNKAIEDLKKAKDALDKNATDKSPLDAAVQKSFDNPDPNDDSKQSVFYKNAKNKTNDTAAQQAVKNYDDALKKAKDVLANDKATKKDVEDAKKALEAAETALHSDKYSTDKTDLGKALADNFSGYLMPAYFNAFDKAQADGQDSQAAKDFKAYNDAYHAAKDLMTELNKPNSTVTQEQADKVKNQLIEARKLIDTYATDTSKLSAAALNNLAIQNSPAYKNLKALAEKENPSEAEKADVEAAKKAKKAYDDAAEKLHKAITNTLPKDQANGHDIPDNIIPKEDGDPNDKDYLKGIQAHKNGEPLNRDVTKILQEMNDAAKGLDKFATKTDKLQESINKDTDTQHDPAYKNAKDPHKLGTDGNEDTSGYADIKQKATDYDEALADAKKLLTDPTATQAQVDAALKKLDEKRDALKAQDTNVEALKKSVDKNGKDAEGANPAVEGTKDSDAYRNASDPHFLTADGKPDDTRNNAAKEAKKAYDKALAEAQELLSKHDDTKTPLDAKPTQKQIDDALTELDTARKTLEDTYKTDTSKLSTEADLSKADAEGSSIDGKFENSPEFKNADAKKDGTSDNEDVKAYKDALKAARDLVKAATDTNKKPSERPTQKQVDEALEALKKAKQTITDGYKTNLDALTAAKDYANGDFKKTPEYKNAKAINDDQNADQDKKSNAKSAIDALDDTVTDSALKKAKDIIDNPTGKTQQEVDEALKTLQAAMDTVTNGYKTVVDPLEKEVGDKDATGKPVTPPFEESIPYKNALYKKQSETGTDATADTSATKKLQDYNDKFEAAKKIIDQVKNPDPNADPDKKPTNADVKTALEALQKAKKAIDDAFTTNAKALKDESAKSTADGVTTVGKDDFEATTEFKNADSKKTDDGKDNADITAYRDALKKARALLEKFGNDNKPKSDLTDVPSQKEVDEALKKLKEIKDKILADYKTSSTELQQEVDKSKDGDNDKRDDVFENTPAFKNATAKGDDAAKKALKDYNDKLTAAKTLLANFDRTTGKPKTNLPAGTKVPTQKQLYDALDALQAAKKKITEGYKTDKSDLNTEAGNDPDFRKSIPFIIGKAADLAEYQQALNDADSVLNDPNATQDQVDQALRRLRDAKQKLIDAYNRLINSGSGVGDNTGVGVNDSNNTSVNNVVDKSVLQAEVDQALGDVSANASGVVADSNLVSEFNAALNYARLVLADANATQGQVDSALARLRAARAALRAGMLAARNSAGMNFKRGDVSGVNTGASSSVFAALAAVFAGLGVVGAASKRRKHSAR